MIACPSCGNECSPTSRFCDQCGSRLPVPELSAAVSSEGGSEQKNISSPNFRISSTTSVGVPAIVEPLREVSNTPDGNSTEPIRSGFAKLIIERGEAANTEYILTSDESYIGRWDADNGIFPDVDLDAIDPDAKVSRRHARIIRRAGEFYIEDLGSTNGTFINRGRRLLPGSPQALKEGDEIIVGKTFLRFRLTDG